MVAATVSMAMIIHYTAFECGIVWSAAVYISSAPSAPSAPIVTSASHAISASSTTVSCIVGIICLHIL